MKVSAIVATGAKREIGYLGKMAWNYPSEYQHFIQAVAGHHIVMGRVNWDDNFSNTRLLSRVTSLVVSTQQSYLQFNQVHYDFDVKTFLNLESAIAFAKNRKEKELFIIGGEQLYKLSLSIVDRIYHSTVPYDGKADTYFPEIPLNQFEIVEEKQYCATEDSPQWHLRIFERKLISL